MCDQLFKNVAFTETPALGRGDPNEILSTLQGGRNFNVQGAAFELSSVAISACQNLAAIGVRDVNAGSQFDEPTTMRNGAHFYVRRSAKGNKDQWCYVGTVNRTMQDEALQVDAILLADDGNSAIAVDYENETMYSLVRNGKQSNSFHIAEQVQAAEGVQWLGVTGNRDLTTIVFRQSSQQSGSELSVFTRPMQRVGSKAGAQSLAPFREPFLIQFDSGDVFQQRFALSQDGTHLLAHVDRAGSQFIVHIALAYDETDGDQQTKLGELLPTDQHTQVLAVKFGGAADQRAFVMLANNNTDNVNVNVFGRVDSATKTLKSRTCAAQQSKMSPFVQDSQSNIVMAGIGSLQSNEFHLVTDRAESDVFVVLGTTEELVQSEFEEPLSVSMWRGCSTNSAWLQCDPIENEIFSGRSSRVYTVDEFARMTLDKSCARSCIVLGEKVFAKNIVGEETQIASDLLVTNPDGNLQLQGLIQQGATFGIRFRPFGVRGAPWQLFGQQTNTGVSASATVIENAQCDAKDLQVALVRLVDQWVPGVGNVPTARDPALFPQDIVEQFLLPLRLCFDTVCFEKPNNVPRGCTQMQTVQQCDDVSARSVFGTTPLRECRCSKSCNTNNANNLASRVWSVCGNEQICEINPKTGKICVFGPLNFEQDNVEQVQLATHPKTGQVYGIYSAGDTNFVFTVEQGTTIQTIGETDLGEFTQIQSTAFRPSDKGVAQPQDALLIVLAHNSDSTSARLFGIDLASGTATTLADLNVAPAGNLASGGKVPQALFIDYTTQKVYVTIDAFDKVAALQEISLASGGAVGQPLFLRASGFGRLGFAQPQLASLTQDVCTGAIAAVLYDRSDNQSQATERAFYVNVNLASKKFCFVSQVEPIVQSLTSELRLK